MTGSQGAGRNTLVAMRYEDVKRKRLQSNILCGFLCFGLALHSLITF